MILISAVSYIAVKNYFFHPNVYPIKSVIFAWAGDTKLMASSSNTIGGNELQKLRSLIQPGDIILNRSDYYISNIGIPGFWTHAGLYIGTPKERNRLFEKDKACTDWVKAKGEKTGDLEELLRKEFDSIYQVNYNEWEEMNIIESVSEGVIISTFEAGAKKDGIVVLRPAISKRELAEGIYKSFAYVTKPYDYNFDFSTDSVIACTELVYKAYENSSLFPVNDMFGKPFSTANEIAEYCDANYDDPQLKLFMVYIFDGENGYTPENDTAHVIFRKSWNESLW
jgi:hypothetical protein